MFHIDIAETRNCRTCGAKDHAGKETGHQVKKKKIFFNDVIPILFILLICTHSTHL